MKSKSTSCTVYWDNLDLTIESAQTALEMILMWNIFC